jgi:hypothetical protein
VQTDLPRQSTVERGTNPPKFNCIANHRSGYFLSGRLFDYIAVHPGFITAVIVIGVFQTGEKREKFCSFIRWMRFLLAWRLSGTR